MTSSARALDGYLGHHRAHVEAALGRVIRRIEEAWPPDLAAAARHGLMGGGKRLRPVLCVAAVESCGGRSTEAAYDLAASVEMIHAYSLMHDDLPCMDDAELRRGRATTWVEHGEEAAMRAGYALIPAAALQAMRGCRALGGDEGRSRRAAGTLLEAAGAGGMVGGQWLDLLGEGVALSATDLDRLHRRKTGALLTASLVMGGIAARASRAVEGALAEYGRAIGLAFQITDDVLDATGSAESLGKNPSDEALEKSTYVALHGLEPARARAAEEIDRALSALERVGLAASPLAPLARYVVERRR